MPPSFCLSVPSASLSHSPVLSLQHAQPTPPYTHSVRRGFQVYREVCASCHAMEHTYFRNLVGVTHSEDEVKKIAEAYDVVDGPNGEGVSRLAWTRGALA